MALRVSFLHAPITKELLLNPRNTQIIAYFILFISPAFFTLNIIFGKALISVEPFTLAFLRWSLTCTILLIFCWSQIPLLWRTFKEQTGLLLFAGFLAFWICGGMVYYALQYTSATNGTLIYTTPPILILIIEAIWRQRPITKREIAGISVAMLGAFAIILRGDLGNLIALDFNKGDLVFVICAISWAIYSVLLKNKSLAHLDTLPLLALVSFAGTLTLFPFMAYEVTTTGKFPMSGNEWLLIAGLVILASLLSFSTFQYGIKILGASTAGVFMYLLPPWGLFFAWFFLGETLLQFHIYGTVLIMSGILIATFPLNAIKKHKLSAD